MKRILLIIIGIMSAMAGNSQDYPIKIKTLKNGLKVIVCEMPTHGFVQSEVWYRVGSKDETAGIRGIAHMFEHMMFRGSKKFPGSLIKRIEQSGITQFNAYTSFDRTVYHEYAPVNYIDSIFDIESDRMANLTVTQEVLNTEREVVAEEFSNGENSWYQKLNYARYKTLYPSGHPYETDVIGLYTDIETFTAEECIDFYNKYYSPNNAFLVVAGDIKSDEIFAKADQYFGSITKQLTLSKRTDVPDLFTSKIKQTDMPIDYPVQIYSFIFPAPATDDVDSKAYKMLMNLLFLDQNSIITERIVNKEKLAYTLFSSSDPEMVYSSYSVIDAIMSPMPGNVKVKKEIREEITKVIASGIPQDRIDKYIKSFEARYVMGSYEPSAITYRLGIAEFFFNNPEAASKELSEIKKITSDDLKRVAAKYLTEEAMQFINIKPSF